MDVTSQAEGNAPTRHPKYYQDISGVVLQVENNLYCVEKSFLCRFQVFRDMFDLGADFNKERDGETDEKPIQLQGVTAFEMDSLLKLAHHDWWAGAPSFNFEECKAILRLAAFWDNEILRNFVIRRIEDSKPPPVHFIALAKQYDIPQWIKPAYVELCKQKKPITLEDGKLLGVESLVEVAQMRERVHSGLGVSFLCKKCGGVCEWRCSSCSKPTKLNTGYHCVSCYTGSQSFCATCKTYWNPGYGGRHDPDLTEAAENVVEEFLKTR